MLLNSMYEKETKIISTAVAALKLESDQSFVAELEEEQFTAATGLEFYGICASL
jgi:hypothetical protein